MTNPVHSIRCGEAWSQLSDTEQAYAYYFYKASWEGAKMGYFQRSYEAPGLFVLFQIVFSDDINEYRQAVLDKGEPSIPV